MKKLVFWLLVLCNVFILAQPNSQFQKLTKDVSLTINEDIIFDNTLDILIPSEDEKYLLYIQIEEPLKGNEVQVLKKKTQLDLSINKEESESSNIELRINNYTGFAWIDISRIDNKDLSIEELRDVKFKELDFKVR